MARLSTLNAIARQELGGRKPQLGAAQPCFLCGQTLTLVESIDLEYYLQTGALIRSGTNWIHAGPEEAAACRRKRGR